MAIQTFDTRVKTPGEQISRGLASGLGGYLDKLATSKLQEIERQRVAQGLQGIGFEEQQAKGLSQLPADLQKEIIKDQFSTAREGQKASSKIMHDVVAAERGAKDNLASLQRIEQLDRTGKVQGLSGELLSKVGLGRLRSAETQELEKLTVGFLTNLKNVFGARPTQYDVQQYLKGLPTLVQSREGRAAVIKNLRVFNEAAKLRGQALRDILKDNKNKLPGDLELQIEDRIGSDLDQLHRELSSDLTGVSSSNGSNNFQSLPNPSQYNGATIRDTQTGQLLVSDGNQWIPKG